MTSTSLEHFNDRKRQPRFEQLHLDQLPQTCEKFYETHKGQLLDNIRKFAIFWGRATW